MISLEEDFLHATDLNFEKYKIQRNIEKILYLQTSQKKKKKYPI